MSSNSAKEQFYEKVTEQIDEPQLIDLGNDLNFTKYALNYFDILTVVQIYQETRRKFLELMQFAKQNGTRHCVLSPNEPGMPISKRTALLEIMDYPGVLEKRIAELRPEFYSPQDTRLLVMYPELAAQAFSFADQSKLIKRLSKLSIMFPKQTLICGQQVYSGFQSAYIENGFATDVTQINQGFVALHTLMH